MKATSLEVSEGKDVTESEQLPFAERVAANQRYLAAHLRKSTISLFADLALPDP